MAIVENNTQLPGVRFNTNVDVTADDLTAMQQYMSEQIASRSKDFIKYPGFAWGIHIANVIGKTVFITAGVGYDQNGIRLEHPNSVSYLITFPEGVLAAYLCVKANPVNTKYKVHPYDGIRHPTENRIGLTFFVATDRYSDGNGNYYPSTNNGLILAKLTVSESTYLYDETITTVSDSSTTFVGNRSPWLKMQDGDV